MRSETEADTEGTHGMNLPLLVHAHDINHDTTSEEADGTPDDDLGR